MTFNSNQQTTSAPVHRWVYWLWLAGPCLVMLLAWLMATGNGRSVSLPGVGVLPETCTMHSRLGIDCPGCGLTRCFVHLAHGRLEPAWKLNPLGLLLFAYVGLQIPLALTMLTQSKWSSSAIVTLRRFIPWNERILIMLLVALLIQWCVRLTLGELY